ncbi:DNA methyltransferase [Paenibacillus sp. GbtcB18]|uniref:DNA methyltransferase n=1 Tax=Paenibacillus sp. GbtcB18 TaxID=2824763 RepID=UPI0020C603BA|nr:DNA methyltransferase [Paenibacillus sp. GbtcB18]
MGKTYKIYNGDCLHELKRMPDNSIDSVVTDPPYGLSKEPDITEVLSKWIAGEPYDHKHGGFMGKRWDSFVPHPDVWKEVYRVLKPGGHALVFAGTRTQDLMATSIRLGGFEIRDVIEWLYFSGFPKSMDVGKAFDKRAGIEREILMEGPTVKRMVPGAEQEKTGSWIKSDARSFTHTITAPASDLAKQWDGWGTALKPAHEPIIVARKPLAGTVANTVEKYSTGALNIDGCRIGDKHFVQVASDGYDATSNTFSPVKRNAKEYSGRFPANCITTEPDAFFSPYFNVTPQVICKKASSIDRNLDWRGAESLVKNTHPTVKPLELMAWLVRLVTPPRRDNP